MPKPKPYVTKTGRVLTDADIDAISAQVEGDLDIAALKARRRGRPKNPDGPAEVVPVRLDAPLRAALDARAAHDDATVSDVIREALRRYLHVA